MKVAQLVGKAFAGADIVVVITLLPETRFAPAGCGCPLVHGKFQCLDGLGKQFNVGFRDEQVNVFGHDDIPVDTKPVAPADVLQTLDENILHRDQTKILPAAIATPGEEVGSFCPLISFQPEWHEETVALSRAFVRGNRCSKESSGSDFGKHPRLPKAGGRGAPPR
jgi:hypothetical protein